MRVTGSSVENTIRGNLMRDNGGLGIDLGTEGVTANDALDADLGANRLQNFPVPDPGVFPGGTTVTGALHAKPGVHYQLDFFASDACDPSGHGESAVYVGFESATTDQDGNADFTIMLFRTVDAGSIITATATDPDGNTSELSPCSAAPPTTTTTSTTTTSTTTTTTSTTTTSTTTTSTTLATTTTTLATTLPPTTVTTTVTSSTQPIPTTTTLPGCVVDATIASVQCRATALRATIGALDALGRVRDTAVGKLEKARVDLDRADAACTSARVRPARAAIRRAMRQLRALSIRLRSRAVARAVGEEGAALGAVAGGLADELRALRRTLACP